MATFPLVRNMFQCELERTGMQELGTGPKTIQDLPAHIVKLAKEQRDGQLPLLFRTIKITKENVFQSNMKADTANIVKQQFTDDTGLPDNGWTAWKNCMDLPPGYCKIGDIFMRYRHGDFVYLDTKYLTDRAEMGSDILVVHKSICLTVPSIPIVDVRNGRMIFAPNPAAYDTNLYTPLGVWCGPRGWEMPCNVVLRCFLKAEVNESLAYRLGELNDGNNRQLDFYRIMQDAVNTFLPVVENVKVTVTDPTRVVYNQGGKGMRLVRKDAERMTNTVAFVLYDILMHCMNQFAGDTQETYASKYDAVWQGWRNAGVPDRFNDAVKNSTLNEDRVLAFMIAYCKTPVADRPDTIKIGNVQFDFRKICACRDQTELDRLKSIHPGMNRLECFSAACMDGGMDVFKLGLNPSQCSAVNICNQNVNVQANVANLKNITLSCNSGDTNSTEAGALDSSDANAAAKALADAAKARESANNLQKLVEAAKQDLAAQTEESAIRNAQTKHETLQSAANAANKAATAAEVQAYILAQKSATAPPNYIMYAGIGMAVAIVLIFIFVGVIVWRRKQRAKK